MSTFQKLLLLSLVIISSLLFVGCGGSSIVMTPNYSQPILHSPHLKRDNIRIVNVVDRRPSRSSQIGIARVGMFNRQVPYILNGELAEVVKTMFDTMVVGKHDQSRFIPIDISISMFEVGENMKLFSEEGYFACNMSFNFPVTPDSSENQVIFLKQTENSGIDVTDAIEPLIYKGMAECASRFVSALDKNQNAMLVSSDSVATIRAKDSIRLSNLPQSQPSTPLPVASEVSNRIKMDELSFLYAQGAKITTGFRISYCMLSQNKDSQVPWGLGMGLTFYDIENKEDDIRGNFVSFAGRLVGKYYLSSAATSVFLGGNLALSGGSEQIDYGNHQETKFFFGPTLEETLGCTLNQKISFEFGFFQLVHFGSKVLPSDVGFVVGLSIRI